MFRPEAVSDGRSTQLMAVTEQEVLPVELRGIPLVGFNGGGFWLKLGVGGVKGFGKSPHLHPIWW